MEAVDREIGGFFAPGRQPHEWPQPMTDNPTMHRLALAMDSAGLTAIRIIFVETSEEELVALWQRSGGEHGDPVADIIAFELERRQVVF